MDPHPYRFPTLSAGLWVPPVQGELFLWADREGEGRPDRGPPVNHGSTLEISPSLEARSSPDRLRPRESRQPMPPRPCFALLSRSSREPRLPRPRPGSRAYLAPRRLPRCPRLSPGLGQGLTDFGQRSGRRHRAEPSEFVAKPGSRRTQQHRRSAGSPLHRKRPQSGGSIPPRARGPNPRLLHWEQQIHAWFPRVVPNKSGRRRQPPPSRTQRMRHSSHTEVQGRDRGGVKVRHEAPWFAEDDATQSGSCSRSGQRQLEETHPNPGRGTPSP